MPSSNPQINVRVPKDLKCVIDEVAGLKGKTPTDLVHSYIEAGLVRDRAGSSPMEVPPGIVKMVEFAAKYRGVTVERLLTDLVMNEVQEVELERFEQELSQMHIRLAQMAVFLNKGCLPTDNVKAIQAIVIAMVEAYADNY